MKRFYIVTPLVLMAAFGVVFWQHSKTSAVTEKAQTLRMEQAKAELEFKKKEAVEKAREDSEKRAAARLAEEKQKEAEKRAKWDETGSRIAAETAANQALIIQNTENLKTLEAELAALRTEKEKLSNKVFTMVHDTETNRIAKRAAEMEIQRLTEMVAKTAANTSLTKIQ